MTEFCKEFLLYSKHDVKLSQERSLGDAAGGGPEPWSRSVCLLCGTLVGKTPPGSLSE